MLQEVRALNDLIHLKSKELEGFENEVNELRESKTHAIEKLKEFERCVQVLTRKLVHEEECVIACKEEISLLQKQVDLAKKLAEVKKEYYLKTVENR